jgi:hypothetical protein
MEKGLNARFHLLLSKTGKAPHKAALVFSFTNGRSESSRDMTEQEAKELVYYLENITTADDPANRMRKKIISMAREMGWELRTTTGKVADMQRIRNWVLKYGSLKKPLNDYTINELPRLVTQFEQVYKDFLNRL